MASHSFLTSTPCQFFSNRDLQPQLKTLSREYSGGQSVESGRDTDLTKHKQFQITLTKKRNDAWLHPLSEITGINGPHDRNVWISV